MRYGTVSFFPNTVIMKINEGDLEKAAFILSGKIFCKILQRMSRIILPCEKIFIILHCFSRKVGEGERLCADCAFPRKVKNNNL